MNRPVMIWYGKYGIHRAEQLASRGAIVRAMVRFCKDATRLPNTSATVVVGNFDDPRSLEAALEGDHFLFPWYGQHRKLEPTRR